LTGETGQCDRRRLVAAAHGASGKPGRCEVRPATCTGVDALGRDIVSFDAKTHPARVRGLAEADGLVFLPAGTGFLAAGALLEFQPFSSC